jgi:hypothetical protein
MPEIELLIILCTATIAISFYAGCCKIAFVINSFTIRFVNEAMAVSETENTSESLKK